MISCTDFIPAYNEMFKYLHNRYGHEAVLKLWDTWFDPNSKTYPLIQYVERDGLKGAWDYWTMISKEEACTSTRRINLKKGWSNSTMHYCPSKGRLLQQQEALGIEPYKHYCDHCNYYRAALKKAGLEWIRDHSHVDKASCSSIIYDPKVFDGMINIDEDTIIAEYRSSDLEYYHPSFHGSMNKTVEYLATVYGEEVMLDYLTQYTKTVYWKVMEEIKEKGLTVLRDMIQDSYNKEHAPEAVEFQLEEDKLSVTVHWCPAVRYLKKIGREISKWYPCTTSVVMGVIAESCGLAFQMGDYDADTGKTAYTFTKI